MQGLTSLFRYVCRLRARLLFRLHYWRKARHERAQLRVELHQLNPWTITEAEQQMHDNAHSRVLRLSRQGKG